MKLAVYGGAVVLAVLLAGCASATPAAHTMNQPTSTPAAHSSAYLTQLQSYGRLSQLTPATVETFSQKTCASVEKTPTAAGAYGAVLGLAMVAGDGVTFDQSRRLAVVIAQHSCPAQVPLLMAVKEP